MIRGLPGELSLDDIVDFKYIVPMPGNGIIRTTIKPCRAANKREGDHVHGQYFLLFLSCTDS
jgi:hypothetical protein